MDIIVTTPKWAIADAAAEAQACHSAGGGEYFRRFSPKRAPTIQPGSRVYYVEDGYLRGYATVTRVENLLNGRQCDTTGRWYAPGFYVFMDATSWVWVEPVPMRGFQGFRYAIPHAFPDGSLPLNRVGDWTCHRPEPACL